MGNLPGAENSRENENMHCYLRLLFAQLALKTPDKKKTLGHNLWNKNTAEIWLFALALQIQEDPVS